MRQEKSGIRYFSLSELPIPSKKKKKKNIDEMKERFEKRHKCVACGQPLTWIPGTNVCSCRNPECRGKKYTYKDENGEEYVEYRPYFHMLDVVGTELAEEIYGED